MGLVIEKCFIHEVCQNLMTFEAGMRGTIGLKETYLARIYPYFSLSPSSPNSFLLLPVSFLPHCHKGMRNFVLLYSSALIFLPYPGSETTEAADNGLKLLNHETK